MDEGCGEKGKRAQRVDQTIVEKGIEAQLCLVKDSAERRGSGPGRRGREWKGHLNEA